MYPIHFINSFSSVWITGHVLLLLLLLLLYLVFLEKSILSNESGRKISFHWKSSMWSSVVSYNSWAAFLLEKEQLRLLFSQLMDIPCSFSWYTTTSPNLI